MSVYDKLKELNITLAAPATPAAAYVMYVQTGNLVFRKATRQFGPPAAMAGRVCIAQVEELVEPGEIDPDDVHLPGVFVHRIVEVGTDIEKRIEKRTVRASGEGRA